MGGPRPAVLGLLCLLSRALLPGFAQEVSTNQNADLESEVPASSTVSSIVTSADRRDSTSIVSEFSDVTHGEKINETIAVTYPPPSERPPTIGASEPFTATTAITEEPNNSTGGAAPSQGDAETRGVTGPSLTQLPPTTDTLTTPVTGEVTTGTPSIFTESPLLPSTPSAPTQNNTETPPGSTHPAATTPALRANQTSSATNLPIMTTAQPTTPATQTATTRHTPEEESDPTLLEVGDVREMPHLHTGSGSNPLFVMIVSVFTIMVVMVVVGVGFHRYKKRNRRTDFRRLQDLPMDDMMEDTPLALYSY
ncbi:uncharacterized protein LOC143926742 isoform X2 [Lithobates pipiens]